MAGKVELVAYCGIYCVDRGFCACYQCDEVEDCGGLRDLHGPLHPDACLRNMRAMREKGREARLAEGPRHYYWMKGVDEPS
jgi:hypothetical protein